MNINRESRNIAFLGIGFMMIYTSCLTGRGRHKMVVSKRRTNLNSRETNGVSDDNDSYLMTTIGFWEFEKPWCVHFRRGRWWIAEKYSFVSSKLEWRLKRHLSLEGYTFISVPRELTLGIDSVTNPKIDWSPFCDCSKKLWSRSYW